MVQPDFVAGREILSVALLDRDALAATQLAVEIAGAAEILRQVDMRAQRAFAPVAGCEMFRTDAELARLALTYPGQRRLQGDQRLGGADAGSAQGFRVDDVHPRRSDETRDKEIVRIFINL